MNDSSRVKMAVKLIGEGCVTKALSHIGGGGLGGFFLHAIQGQLAEKFPQGRVDWASPVTTSPPRFDTPDVRKYYKNLRRRAGVGADGFRNGYLLRPIRGQVGEATRAKVLKTHQQLADHVTNGDFPPWFMPCGHQWLPLLRSRAEAKPPPPMTFVLSDRGEPSDEPSPVSL